VEKVAAVDNDKNNKCATESETGATRRGRQKIWTLTLYEDLCVLVEFFSPQPPSHPFTLPVPLPSSELRILFRNKCE